MFGKKKPNAHAIIPVSVPNPVATKGDMVPVEENLQGMEMYVPFNIVTEGFSPEPYPGVVGRETDVIMNIWATVPPCYEEQMKRSHVPSNTISTSFTNDVDSIVITAIETFAIDYNREFGTPDNYEYFKNDLFQSYRKSYGFSYYLPSIKDKTFDFFMNEVLTEMMTKCQKIANNAVVEGILDTQSASIYKDALIAFIFSYLSDYLKGYEQYFGTHQAIEKMTARYKYEDSAF